MSTKPHLKAYIALLTGLVIIGFSAVLIKSAEAPGLITAFYRVAIGSLVLIFPFVYKWKAVKALSKKGIYIAVLGGIAFGIDTGLWSMAIELSNATIPTLMANLAPVWVGFGAALFFKEKQNKGFWIGLSITLAGMIVMVYRSLYVQDGLFTGISLGVLAGMFYGAYHLFTQQGRQLMGTLQYLSISTFAAALTVGIIILFTSYSFTGYNERTWLIYLVYGIGVHVGGWTLINYAQGYLKATTVSPTLLGQPVLTAIAAYVVLGESLSAWQIVGGMIVFSGIYIVNYTRLKRK
ncbi:DMT family transporter [Carboxylicivirga sp. N1Y90]|uniref:DMT family transporter n=1 Tax=Carboxylicivirga fragile TaxID=3417571 RepID=UPI003D349D5E|nr:DMT family transporter [Marinilabiliaceae bacterium N1Y90]